MREDDENLAVNSYSELAGGERMEHDHSSAEEDPLIESICSLQAAQEALEQEIKKFGEIGSKPLSTIDLGFHKPCLSGHSDVEGSKQISSSSLELQVLSLTENVTILESKWEELQGMLSLKDSKIAELETALCGEEKFKEEESELESLFRQKIEAEVEYLAIAKIMQNLKVASAFMSLEKQETLSGNRVQVPNKLGEYCGEILEVEETFMIQRSVYKLTFLLLLQFMLLILVFWLLEPQLWPDSGVVLPT